VIACNLDGRVRMITALARQYLTDYFGAPRNLDRQLPAQLLGWFRSQSTHRKLKELPSPPIPLTVRRRKRSIDRAPCTAFRPDLLLLAESTSHYEKTSGTPPL
jgi:hypothetical protein